MPDPPAPLYLDEDVSVVVATTLQARGFDVVTTRDLGKLGRTDAEQLATSAMAGRVFLTHNRVDFESLHGEWLQAGRAHAGIIVARRHAPSELASRVGRLLSRLTADDLKNQLLYV
ncbi:MAG: DUF5615 family PIN-like protein [Nitrospirota bacterium]